MSPKRKHRRDHQPCHYVDAEGFHLSARGQRRVDGMRAQKRRAAFERLVRGRNWKR